MNHAHVQVEVLDREVHGYLPAQSPDTGSRSKPIKRQPASESRRILSEMDATNPWEAIVKRDPAIRMHIEAEMDRDGWDRSSNQPGRPAESQTDFDCFVGRLRDFPREDSE